MRTRDPWLDNVKTLLIAFVVMGHFWVLANPEPGTVAGTLYPWLYVFHIPAFVAVTGYLSKSFTYSKKHLTALFFTLALPYVITEAALTYWRVGLGEINNIENLWLNPHWPTWYLVAVIAWRLATPILKQNPLIVLPLTLGVSLTSGVWLQTQNLDLPRILGLLIFYTLGLHATPQHLEWVKTKLPQPVAAGALLASLPIALWVYNRWGMELLYWRSNYNVADISNSQGMAVRTALILTAVACTLGLLRLTSKKQIPFTHIGAATLGIYLGHGFILKFIDTQTQLWQTLPAYLALALLTATACAVTWTLATPTAQRLLTPLTDVRKIKTLWAPSKNQAPTEHNISPKLNQTTARPQRYDPPQAEQQDPQWDPPTQSPSLHLEHTNAPKKAGTKQ